MEGGYATALAGEYPFGALRPLPLAYRLSLSEQMQHFRPEAAATQSL